MSTDGQFVLVIVVVIVKIKRVNWRSHPNSGARLNLTKELHREGDGLCVGESRFELICVTREDDIDEAMRKLNEKELDCIAT